MRAIGRSFLGLLLVAGVYSSAGAGDLYLNEFATPSMGVAGAGQEAIANDASTDFAFHNPAGMTRLEGHSIALGAGPLQGDTEFDTDPDTPFDGGKCEGDWREGGLVGAGEGWKNGQSKKCYMEGGTIKFTD